MTKALDERLFPAFRRGQLRDEWLAFFRSGLRRLTNPATGQPYSEDEIQVAAGPLTYDYARAEALDLMLLAAQSRALWLCDQVDERRASTEWLEQYHAPRQGLERLGASSGAGPARCDALTGTVFVGSTSLGDPAAHWARAKSGARFQVLYTAEATAGTVDLALVAIDPGENTNLETGETLTWANGPIGAGALTVIGDFRGGAPVETDAQWSKRITAERLARAGAGTRAQWRSWAMRIPGVAEAYVYPCAYYGNSVQLCVLGRRGTTKGPNARIASEAVLQQVAGLLTAPGGELVPGTPLVVVTTAQALAVTVTVQLRMARESAFGWADAEPWPGPGYSAPTVSSITSQTNWTFTWTGPPPPASPRIMLWRSDEGAFFEVPGATVTDLGAGSYRVESAEAPKFTVAGGMLVSPYTDRHEAIAEAIVAYLDTVGPGELVTETDLRYFRTHRYPLPEIEAAPWIDSTIARFLEDSLGSSVSSIVPTYSTATTPTPANTAAGPRMLTLGHVRIHQES